MAAALGFIPSCPGWCYCGKQPSPQTLAFDFQRSLYSPETNTLFRDLHHHPENSQFQILSGVLLPQPAQSTTWPPTRGPGMVLILGTALGTRRNQGLRLASWGTGASSSWDLEQENGYSWPEKGLDHANNLLPSLSGPGHTLSRCCQSKLTDHQDIPLTHTCKVCDGLLSAPGVEMWTHWHDTQDPCPTASLSNLLTGHLCTLYTAAISNHL